MIHFKVYAASTHFGNLLGGHLLSVTEVAEVRFAGEDTYGGRVRVFCDGG